ncbi:TIGR03618 family F420-dependent PPOX class oxidoreductase [Solirubrobacter phytolaccae]|uniref:TIGR03618 family F420-dependent PPOX class oxidoreductase n=1 Tax=Solirubrobacter phytolaccae TaxID=1404360 RepID=A0A9X3NFH2_9ACTN|nr:TIGR03618 family F420-dependent PPOX class oxidoreductase [Solirubrobacter phytolaccae]MDA0185116.1 TIGR03618 family F420-dependent PPOX class oxidoreductase [Solirubrobacter phytolaccae]
MDDDVRALLGAPNIAHLATLLKDGAPHSIALWIGVEGELISIFTWPKALKARNMDRDDRVAISVHQHDRPLTSATIRGRVVQRLEGDPAWAIVDRMSQDYQGTPYPRDQEMVVYLIEPERVRFEAY